MGPLKIRKGHVPNLHCRNRCFRQRNTVSGYVAPFAHDAMFLSAESHDRLLSDFLRFAYAGSYSQSVFSRGLWG